MLRFMMAACVQWRLFFLDDVFDAADGVLDLAFEFISLTLGLQLGVTDCLANGLLYFPFYHLRRPNYPVFVHHPFPQLSLLLDKVMSNARVVLDFNQSEPCGRGAPVRGHGIAEGAGALAKAISSTTVSRI